MYWLEERGYLRIDIVGSDQVRVAHESGGGAIRDDEEGLIHKPDPYGRAQVAACSGIDAKSVVIKNDFHVRIAAGAVISAYWYMWKGGQAVSAHE